MFPTAKAEQNTENRASFETLCLFILKRAVNRNASDIHITPLEDSAEIYFRTDGDLMFDTVIAKEYDIRLVNILKLNSGLDTSNHITVQEGQMSVTLPDDTKKSDFRVSVIPTEYGEKAVIRILGKGLISSERQKLGFTKEDDLRLTRAIDKKRGLILLCGATGSGKTTTIYSFLNSLSRYAVNITTIEDPIEYLQVGITQTEVNSGIGYTYEKALKAVLRQDADIIYVGEIRDSETASAAINAVMTGHMVFSSVHSENVTGAFARLLKLGIQRQQLAETINTVIAQKLVRKVCPDCAVKRMIKPDEAAALGVTGKIFVYEEKGCEKCGGLGFKGRTAAYEIFTPDDDEKEIIASSSDAFAVKRLVDSHGNLNAFIIKLMKERKISVMEALQNII